MSLFEKMFGGSRQPQRNVPPPVAPTTVPPPIQKAPESSPQSPAVKAHLRNEAEKLYRQGARLVYRGIRQNESGKLADGLEMLVRCEEIAPGFLDPLKLYYRVVWSRMPSEEQDKAMFIERRRHATEEKLAFLDRLEDGLEAFDDRQEHWREFASFVNALPETQESKRQARVLYDDASRLIQEGLTSGAPALMQEGFKKVREAIKLDFEFLDAWKLYCQMAFTGSRGKDQLPEEREWAQNDPAKLQFLDELLAGKHPLQKQSRSSPKESAEAAFCEATRLHEEGNEDKAMELLKVALQHEPDHLEARIAASWAYSELEQWDSAVLHANRAADLAPDDEGVRQTAFNSYIGKGHQLELQERWLDAYAFFKKAVLVDVKNRYAETAFNAMWLLEGKPDCRDVFVGVCKDILAIAPDWAYVRFRLGRSLMNGRRPQEALPYLEEAVQNKPEDLERNEWLFLSYAGCKQHGKAKRQFEVLQRMNSPNLEKFSALVRDEDGPPTDEAAFHRFFGQN
jgi:tetratricopeptide (TPR) repeat protein